MPRLAVLRTAAQVGHAVDAALLDEHQRRGAESRGHVDLETAVPVEQAGVLAVELHVLAAGDEHRDLRAVLRGIEDLLGGEERGIEAYLGRLVEGRFTRGDVIAVDCRRSRIVRQRVVDLLVLLLAAEAAHRADGGQRHLTHQLALEVILRDAALRILQVGGKEVSAGRADPLKQILRILGDHHLVLRGTVQVDAPQRVVRGIAVGDVVETVVLDGHHTVVGIEARQQRTEALLGSLPIEHLGPGGSLRSAYEEPLAVLRGPYPEVAQRVVLVLVDEAVGRLRRAELVVVDLLELVLVRIDALLGGIVGTVVETLRVGRPRGAGVLHPLNAVFGQRSRSGIHHPDLDPVRTGCGRRIGQVAAVLRERRRGQRHRTVLGERVGVEEEFARLTGPLRAVERRLVLQPVVIIIVPPVAVLRGRPLLGIVPQLGQPVADRPAERNLREVVLRHGVLGLDPCGRGLRTVVLEPAVGVGHLHAEIVVRHRAPFGLGIGQMLYLFHVRISATCGSHGPQHEGRSEK